MKILRTPAEMKSWRSSITGRVGFVPTMGALHDGHAQLMRQARAENDQVVLSVFVNPTQFNDPKDFEKYPITWDSDVKTAEAAGVDAIFSPVKDDLYPDGYAYRVTENRSSLPLEGASRPGHFDGVLSIVLKLFQLVKPTKAYFGEKDYQQLHLIDGMAKALFLDLQVVPVATVREKDGLAMSSRNVRLNPEQRQLAPEIYRALTQEKSAEAARDRLQKVGFKVDYVTDWEGRRFVAAFLGETRLIDNVAL